MASISFTKAVASQLSDGALVDILKGTRNGLKHELNSFEAERTRKHQAIAREVLLKRGYSKEVLDYDPEVCHGA